MVEEFVFWVMGVIEDDPLPWEAEEITFCLHRESVAVFLSFGARNASEKGVLGFDYYPLEAQFFRHRDMEEGFNLFSLRRLLGQAFKWPNFEYAFSGKDIFYGVWGEKEVFKFE